VRFFALSPYFSSWNRGSAGVALRHVDALLENEAFVPSQISLPCINTPIQMWKAPDTNEECPSRAPPVQMLEHLYRVVANPGTNVPKDCLYQAATNPGTNTPVSTQHRQTR
jgi:hypothetical protein